MSEPIFDQLQAEFVEQSKFVRLQIGPPIGEGFERVEVIDEQFGTTGYVHKMVEVEEVPTPNPDFVESIVQSIKDAKSISHEMTDSVAGMALLERNLIKTLQTSAPLPRMYVVEGAPDLIDVRPKLIADLDDTTVFPAVQDDVSEPPSSVVDTRLTPRVEEAVKPNETDPHVFPVKSHHKAPKKTSATGSLSWFTRAA